jgi:hypothetical protein
MDGFPILDSMELLKRPFAEDKIHWRVGSTNAKKLGCKPWEATKGSALAYVDARDVMQRLDEVIGAQHWQCRYPLADSGLLICEVGIRISALDSIYDMQDSGDQFVWKANGAGDTQVEAEKGKCSDAFKRAAVLWGVARYLYYLPFSWVDLENGRLKYNPPLPKWATPEGWDMLTADKEAKDAGHSNVNPEREPQEPITDIQRELLNKHLDAFKLNPAAVREAKQLEKYLNSDNFTAAHARDILRKFEENG